MFVRFVVLLGLALVLWTVAARPSGAHGERVAYRVKAHDTLWTIASSHYAGDVRGAVWRIQRTNGLRDPTVHPGQTLVLP